MSEWLPPFAASTSRFALRRIPGRGHYGLAPGECTLGELFSDAGYATASFGKWHVGDIEVRLATDQSFDEWFGIKNTSDEAGYSSYPLFAESGFPVPKIWEGLKGSAVTAVEDFNLQTRPLLDEEIARRAGVLRLLHAVAPALDSSSGFQGKVWRRRLFGYPRRARPLHRPAPRCHRPGRHCGEHDCRLEERQPGRPNGIDGRFERTVGLLAKSPVRYDGKDPDLSTHNYQVTFTYNFGSGDEGSLRSDSHG